MAEFDDELTVGTRVRLDATFTPAGSTTPTDPPITKFRWRTPAGVVAEYVYGVDAELVRDSAGKFHAFLLLDEPGRWWLQWRGSGNAGPAATDETAILVRSVAVGAVTP